MATYNWPITLPQGVLARFDETHRVSVLSSPMDKGPAKVRFKSKLPRTFSVSYLLTDVQLGYLDDFLENVIKYTAPFNYPHPRTGAIVDARIVFQDNGTAYELTSEPPVLSRVSISFELLP